MYLKVSVILRGLLSFDCYKTTQSFSAISFNTDKTNLLSSGANYISGGVIRVTEKLIILQYNKQIT